MTTTKTQPATTTLSELPVGNYFLSNDLRIGQKLEPGFIWVRGKFGGTVRIHEPIPIDRYHGSYVFDLGRTPDLDAQHVRNSPNETAISMPDHFDAIIRDGRLGSTGHPYLMDMTPEEMDTFIEFISIVKRELLKSQAAVAARIRRD